MESRRKFNLSGTISSGGGLSRVARKASPADGELASRLLMLSPKAHSQRPATDRAFGENVSRSLAEPRAFALETPGCSGAAPARWPEAWARLEPDLFIRIPTAVPTVELALG